MSIRKKIHSAFFYYSLQFALPFQIIDKAIQNIYISQVFSNDEKLSFRYKVMIIHVFYFMLYRSIIQIEKFCNYAIFSAFNNDIS